MSEKTFLNLLKSLSSGALDSPLTAIFACLINNSATWWRHANHNTERSSDFSNLDVAPLHTPVLLAVVLNTSASTFGRSPNASTVFRRLFDIFSSVPLGIAGDAKNCPETLFGTLIQIARRSSVPPPITDYLVLSSGLLDEMSGHSHSYE